MELQSLEPPELDKEEQEALIRHHEAEELLKKLTLEEKVSLLTGKTMWEAGGVPRLNLPRLRFSDGPHGARGEGLHGTVGAALAPCLSALAATFNEEIILKVGEILGQECAARGANVLLGPTVNIHRSPITGRHFECFSEDPFLTSGCAVSYVRGVQRFSAACVKHFVGNDQEADRGHSNSVISERVLHEVYLQPFEACVRQAGAQAIMPGYNRLNGQYCAENRHLLQEVLRDTWQFQGLVVSDWWANRTTNKALEAGLNVEMPGIEPRYFGGYLLEQARDGRVSTELLDERCRPILRTLLRFPRTGGTKAPEISKRKAIFTKAAVESLVLLKNSGALPLRTTPVARVAVVGPKARATTLQGGGSSRVHPDRSPSILSELEKALDSSGVQLVHETGCMMGQRPTKNPELEGLKRMGACDANGQPISFHFEAKLLDVILRIASICSQKEFFRRRVMPCLRPLGLRHTDPDEAHKSIVSMEWGSGDGSGVERRGTMMLWGLLAGGLCGAAAAGVAAAAAGSAALCAALVGAGGALGAIGAEGLRQRHVQALENESRSMTRAEALAADCDATVLVVGTDGFWECEGVDQPHMRLPGRQDELVRRCAAAARAAGKAVVVVLNVGSPKELPWLEDVDAVLLSYFGGECTAASISQCLLGACPAGRLPTSWPRCLAEASSKVARASKMDRPGDVEYHEGLHLGYRNGDLDPAFHFGHGLSYTRFEHSDLQVEQKATMATVTLQVKNVGAVAGAEVVQLYITTLQVPRALKAFARTKTLQPQESCKVTLQLDERALGSFYDPDQGGWVRPLQDREILLEVGASSKDVRLSQKLIT